MYHLELRQFPHNMCRFNLTAEQLRVIVDPWARQQWVEVGERKWSPHAAKLTVLEGPQIPVEQLSMGRGWRTAQRQSEDVTERVLVAARQPAGGGTKSAPAASPSGDAGLLAESLGLELLSLLGDDAAALVAAWRLAVARNPERTPSECLALAEQAVRSSGPNAS